MGRQEHFGLARSPGTAPGPDPSAVVISITCPNDGLAHLVPDTELAAEPARSGHYQALCGDVVTAASMVEPDGVLCPSCSDARHAHLGAPVVRGPRRRV